MKTESYALKSRINIVLIEDHTAFRNGFALLLLSLDERFHILFMAANGEEFIEKLSTHVLPDLVITDLRMNGMDGFRVLSWMGEHYPKIPVVALTMFNEQLVCDKVKAYGGKGLLLKDSDNDIIKKAVDIIMAGGYYFAAPGPDAVLEKYTEEQIENINPLNGKEKELAEQLCEDVSLETIADKLHISNKTAERYRTLLYLKTGVKSRIGFVRYAFKNGWFNW